MTRRHEPTCGHHALAVIIGWTPHQVQLHIRALREQRGERMARQGSYAREQEAVLRHAGWKVERFSPAVPFKTVQEFLRWQRRVNVPEWFLVHTPGHVFVAKRGKVYTWAKPRARIGYLQRVIKAA